jgi:hypothetical protein
MSGGKAVLAGGSRILRPRQPGFPEAELIDKGLERAVSGIARLLSEPVERVMHELNRKEPS